VSVLFSNQRSAASLWVDSISAPDRIGSEASLYLVARTHGWRHTFLLLGFTGLLWVIPWLWNLSCQMRSAAGARAPALPNVVSQLEACQRNLLGISGIFCFDYYGTFSHWLPTYSWTVRHLSIVQAGFYRSLAFFIFGSLTDGG